MLLRVEIALVSGLDLVFFAFPVAPENRRRNWIVDRRKGWMPAKHSRVGGDHFVSGTCTLYLWPRKGSGRATIIITKHVFCHPQAPLPCAEKVRRRGA